MINKSTKWLFIIMVIELVLGGGRLISFGVVSLRMVLFGASLVLTGILIYRGERIPIYFTRLIILFTLMLVMGMVIGLLSGANSAFIFEDVKPLLFFYTLPFFYLAIRSKENIEQVYFIIKSASTSMSILFLMLILLINVNVIPFLDFYGWTVETGEFFYRGETTFFYKGFVYLCVGFIIIQTIKGKSEWWWLAILFSAIFFTFTRGFLLALSLTYAFSFIIQKSYIKIIATLLIGLAVVFYGKDLYEIISKNLIATEAVNTSSEAEQPRNEKLLGDREFSDNQRKAQLMEVFDSITVTSTFIGHGFGNGVTIRPVHMEISYLEIFHKQGLFGLSCWLIIFITLYKLYKEIANDFPLLSKAFFLASIFMFAQSLTNQYINNPIGLGMIILSLVCMERLKPLKNDTVLNHQ